MTITIQQNLVFSEATVHCIVLARDHRYFNFFFHFQWKRFFYSLDYCIAFIESQILISTRICNCNLVISQVASTTFADVLGARISAATLSTIANCSFFHSQFDILSNFIHAATSSRLTLFQFLCKVSFNAFFFFSITAVPARGFNQFKMPQVLTPISEIKSHEGFKLLYIAAFFT